LSVVSRTNLLMPKPFSSFNLPAALLRGLV
jgi:hypothetical protein